MTETLVTASPRLSPLTCQDVLIVDDDPAVLRVFARIVEQGGFHATTAPDGPTAAKLLLDKPFCAVVSDVTMPGMSGLELLRCTKVHDLDVPVILITGAADVSTATEAVSHGAFQLLTKPIAPKLLVSEVKRAARNFSIATDKRHAMRLLEISQEEEFDLHAAQRALDNALSTLRMVYQPIVDPTGRVYGYESLMRSHEPSLPNPPAVLDAAERFHKLHALGRAVRERSVKSFHTPYADAQLFINLHANELLDPQLLSACAPTAALADRIVFEITERASLADVSNVKERIAALREMGYRIALDDLGAGYASLTSLMMLEPEFVKIDMSLVRDVDTTPLKQKFVKLLVAACKDSNIKVIAEGIETREERETLGELGCDLFQGYWFGKPAPLGAIPQRSMW